jgi:putative nucleotidyltransferase with HDIG domain
MIDRRDGRTVMKEKSSTPCILIFSPRENVRNILTAGLSQAKYRTIEASSSYIAGIKANQFLPDLIIADITKKNIKDFLFLTRLERSIRTDHIVVLLSLPPDVKKSLDMIREEIGTPPNEQEKQRLYFIEYPYSFETLTKTVQSIFENKKKDAGEEPKHKKESQRSGGDYLFNPNIPVANKLQFIEENINRQWAFPFTVIRSLEIIGAESSCCNELAKCIESDLAATSAILGIANTTQFAGRYSRTTNVTDAVVRIGFNETRNLLATLALIDISSELYLKFGFKRGEFWMHSLATAIMAQKLCEKTAFKRPETAFIAGLMHDIGKIPLDNLFTDVFSRILEETTNKITSFADSEVRMMGFTHAALGHSFATAWDFPSSIKLALLNHHSPEKILANNNQLDRIPQEAVYAANIFAKAVGMGHSCDEVLFAIPPKMLADLNIPEGPSKQFIAETAARLKQYYEYLKVSDHNISFNVQPPEPKQIEVAIISGGVNNFHPILLGLQNAGYPVTITHRYLEGLFKNRGVALFIPDEGHPLEITLTDDEEIGESQAAAPLKIFLLDHIENRESKRQLSKSNMLLMDANNTDLRFILQVIEDYYYATSM